MYKIRYHLFFAALYLLSVSVNAFELNEVQVVGLFKNSAVVNIQGKQQILKIGQKKKGVRLISADSKNAVLEINGEQHTLAISRARSSGGYQQREEVSTTISINSFGQYFAAGSINNQPVSLLVDTGATAVALNTRAARKLGIDFTQGQAGRVSTAGGIVKSYSVVLDSIKVGEIEAKQVRAVVLEGIYPSHILLGMTYLSQVKIREDAGVMTLIKKY